MVCRLVLLRPPTSTAWTSVCRPLRAAKAYLAVVTEPGVNNPAATQGPSRHSPVAKVDPLDVKRSELATAGQEASAGCFEQRGDDVFDISMTERLVFEVRVRRDIACTYQPAVRAPAAAARVGYGKAGGSAHLHRRQRLVGQRKALPARSQERERPCLP